MDRAATGALEDFAAHHHLSARSVHRLMRVARTIADLDGRTSVTAQDVNGAGSLRDPALPTAAALAA